MFVKADRLVVVAIEESLAMQLGLVDQAREMNIAAELLVRTARMQSSHGETIMLRATAAPRPTVSLTQTSSRLLSFRTTTRLVRDWPHPRHAARKTFLLSRSRSSWQSRCQPRHGFCRLSLN